jgi:precorrin-6B methylase 2
VLALDIGAGRGTIACRAGAARDLAIKSDDVIERTQQIAANNGSSSRVEFVRAIFRARQ